MNVPERLKTVTLGSRIKAARERRKLSVAEVVIKTGIDRATLYALEAGTRPLRLRHLVQLHVGLQTRPGEILSV
jgi:transcriptional regulator with XRE-family HTH domain